jgi:hypothetical protein
MINWRVPQISSRDFEYFSPGNIKLPFQGAEYMSLLTQGVALGWYKLAFQAGIA